MKKAAEIGKKKLTLNGMTKSQLEKYHLWDFKKLENYLLRSVTIIL